MTRTPSLRRLIVPFVVGALALSTIVPTAIATDPNPNKKPKDPVSVQILGLNDYHGQLEVVPPTASSSGRIGALTDTNPDLNITTLECLPVNCVPAGGTEYLATHVNALRATNPNTVFVSAGDMIGATPLLSALFHDEPSIEAFNIMGLDYAGVGNHEFDEGVDELLRIAYGDRTVDDYVPARPDGCHPVDGCGDGDPYNGADFQYLAANVAYRDSGETIFPPYAIRDFPGGVKIAFVGMTLEGTPEIVSPTGIASVRFNDEADSVNALVPFLKQRNVSAIVVLLHEGGSVQGGAGGSLPLINSCNGPAAPNSPNSPTGAIVDVVNRMDDEIDVVVSGHTNWAVNCLIDGKVVTGAAAQGRLITDIDAQLDRNTKDFVPGSITVNNRIVTRDVAKAPAITSLMAEYNAVAGPIAAVVVGATTAPLTRTAINATTADTQLGRLIADAQLAHPSVSGAQIAFMNPGGIRSDLDAGPITHGEAFGVQPFSNVMMVRTFTGAEIETILEQQFVAATGAPRVILQVSAGFTYEYKVSAPAGNKVDPASIKLNGTTISPTGTYTVAMNNFLGFGGDSFPGMLAGDLVKFGEDDLVVLEAYLATHNPYDPATTGPSRVVIAP